MNTDCADMLRLQFFMVIVSLLLLDQVVVSDDRVRYDWINGTTLQNDMGFGIVQQSGSSLNLQLCAFDSSNYHYLICDTPVSTSTATNQIYPFSTYSTSTLLAVRFFGVWLTSLNGAWSDLVFGTAPFSPQFNVGNIVRLASLTLKYDTDLYMSIQPTSIEFPSVLMRLYLQCNNGTTYFDGMMDLSPYVTSGQQASFNTSVYQMSRICTQACAEIYIQGILRNTGQVLQFRVGHLCGSLTAQGQFVWKAVSGAHYVNRVTIV